MHIKRFEGSDMRDVLRQVREELGPEALVLSTRHVKKGGAFFGSFGRAVVEVTAAVDRDQRRGRADAGSEHRAKPDSSWNELRVARALIHPLEAEIQQLRGAVERLASENGGPTEADLREEIAALRRAALQSSTLEETQPGGLAGETMLERAGLAPRHRRTLLATEPKQRVAALASLLDDALSPPRPESDTITLYVGPAGVGKTTTLAKVASRTEAASDGLAVFSTDAHRLGAEARLQAWANHRGIPFATATSPAGIATAVSRLGRRPVLVDTAGHSRRDVNGLCELRALRDALGERARVCLVLPATRKEVDLRDDIESFGILAPDAMAITQVDESRDLGNVGNILLDGGCPSLHWITTGQRVPDDLSVADPDDLARRILGAAA